MQPGVNWRRYTKVKSSRKSTVIILSCVAAATAGVFAIVATDRWKVRNAASLGVKSRLRDVQEVLADCYTKIHEIERQLPDQSTVATTVAARSSLGSAPTGNGRPIYDAG